MPPILSAPGNQEDERVLEDAFQAAIPTIETLVTTALQRGQQPGALALLLERTFEGEIRGGCGARAEVQRRLEAREDLPTEVRASLVARMNGQAFAGIPAVFIVHAEGGVSAGLRFLPGQIVAVS